MKSTRWIVLAVALTGCAVAYSVHLLTVPEERPSRSASTVASKKSAPKFTAVVDYAASSHRPQTPRRRDDVRQASSESSAKPIARMIIAAPSPAGGPVLAESKWRHHAAQVEMEANHELQRLTGLLDLDPVQQDQVFSRLARQSDYWLSGMATARPAKSHSENPRPIETAPSPSSTPASTSSASTGTATPAADTQSIADVLTPAQLETLVDEEWERQAWWEEILPQLLPPADPDPQVFTNPAPVAEPLAIKEVEQSSTTLGEE